MFIKLFAAFFFAYYFVNVAGVHMIIKRMIKRDGRLKPFDCVNCLSVWIALLLFFMPINVSECIFIAFGAGFTSTRIK